MKQVNVGILGCGTVGTGVAKILMDNKDIISSRVGAVINLKYVADIDTETDRGITFDDGVFISDANKVIDDPEVHIIIEMIGGESIAKEFILKAINNGKHIVTANKALLAGSGNQLLSAASEKGCDIFFEASVGGGMPVIKTLRESLACNKIQAVTGILNGTCNYILSKITTDGNSFEDALAKAQAKGFAEADPTLDVEGFDTAHKLSILSALAYGMEINFKDIYVEGITKIAPMDFEFARQFGYSIKLLAISKDNGNGIEARVHPTMIPHGNILSNVTGSLNAVTVTGDGVGDIFISGHGAGMMPTASAVVGDVVDIARNILSGTTGRVPLFSYQKENIKKVPVLSINEISTNYYLRF
ncbi:MAG: homoserine dehydrogenase, partial [Desulfobacteraceae bacterium]|nr:homoserine dehydrogenase [Desulfobacteraceae bacterium]